jgi:transcriptional regulator with XRE-family HTH domain
MLRLFPQRLKKLRQSKGYTQTQLALKVGTGRTSISNWEHGTRVPDSEMIAKLSSALKVPVDYLLGSMPDYSVSRPIDSRIDLSKLNSVGLSMLLDYYKFLLCDEKYTV